MGSSPTSGTFVPWEEIVILGKCRLCERKKPVRMNRKLKRRICQACYRLTNTGICVSCNQDRPISVRLPNGELICDSCYGRECNFQRCDNCGFLKHITLRKPSGEVICKNCYQKTYIRPAEMCGMCGQDKPVAMRLNKKPVCKTCYDAWFRTPESQASRNA